MLPNPQSALPPAAALRALPGQSGKRFSDLWTVHQLDERTRELGATATLLPPTAETVAAPNLKALPQLGLAGKGDRPPDLAMGNTIGEGGMGVVRSAKQLSLGREVAVKTLRPEQATPAAIHKLMQEALITGTLEHPDIIPVYALGQDERGLPMLVMKRVEGTNWSDLLHQPDHPLLTGDPREPLVFHLEVLARVCHAVAFAHGKGILHRDLKTANVMIGRFGEVYVLDWGIAVALRDDGTGCLPLARDAQAVAGTPSAMAPEMVHGDGSLLGEHTDVFLLGAILHEILTGKMRFGGTDLYQVMFAAYECLPYSYSDDLPAELVAICQRATAREPTDRYPSAAALRTALSVYLQHRTSLALHQTARAAMGQFQTALGQPPSEATSIEVRRALTEARLALREALRAWPENQGAQADLRDLLLRGADWHLLTGDVEGAAALAEELGPDPAELHQRVEAARQEVARTAAEVAKLQRDFDPRIGARTRSFLAMVLALGWSILPMTLRFCGDKVGHRLTSGELLAATGLFAGFIAFAAVWARESMFRSHLNRSLLASGAAMTVAVFAVRALCWHFGFPFEVAMTFDLVVFGLVLAMLTATQWRRLGVPSAVFFTGAAFAATHQEWVLETTAVSNLVAMSMVAFAWRPADYDDCAIVAVAATPVKARLIGATEST
ncbi:MAG: protein kinase [Deltaproteobacteria bacterium]|nr:protein kinase [Deltaproteobacteria bacterium]